MKPEDLKAGDRVAVHVPQELPDPTDPAFGCMEHGILEVVAVGEGWFHYRVLFGTAYWKGAEGSIPFKYAPYITILKGDQPPCLSLSTSTS